MLDDNGNAKGESVDIIAKLTGEDSILRYMLILEMRNHRFIIIVCFEFFLRRNLWQHVPYIFQ